MLMAEVPPILPGFLYPSLYLLGNLVTSSTCYGLVIVKFTAGIVEDQLWMVVDGGGYRQRSVVIGGSDRSWSSGTRW